MSTLPERASLEYLKKLAKDRVRELRQAAPRAQLADALTAVAREHGFASWRALKAELDRRRDQRLAQFFDACNDGDLDTLRALLAHDPALAQAADPRAAHRGWTGLHTAARRGRADVVRLLLDHGADVNAREAGDNTSALHWAAAHDHLDTVRTLLDAGADVHGDGDLHELGVIGWGTFYREPGSDPTVLTPSRRALIALLLERGARHHIFSAIFANDLDAIQHVVEGDPSALDRRLSRFDRGLTPLHVAIERRQDDILALLIALGADVDAEDLSGRTPLAFAMLRGDRDAMRRLRDAGATMPEATPVPAFAARMAALGGSVTRGVPMLHVPDVARALAWYASIGFKEIARYDDNGDVNFGMVAFGAAQVMLVPRDDRGPRTASVWLYTRQVDEIYRLLKSRQLDAAHAALDGRTGAQPSPDADPGSGLSQGFEFTQDLEDMFYGARQFCIRDPNGYELYFIQLAESPDAPERGA